MKKRNVVLLITFISILTVVNAQSSFGIKAGLSYNTNGKLAQLVNNTKTFIDNKGSGKSGFNVGFYGKMNLGPVYVRPELVYTRTTSEYDLGTTNEDFKMSKLDLPVLVGFKLLGPLDAFVGPAFQYILNNDFRGNDHDSLKNDVTIGLNIGLGIELGNLGVDVRYERGLSKNEAKFIIPDLGSSSTYTLDSRPEQFIVNLSYRLSDKK